jgi:DNA-binding PadR family transcriptional regulator
VLEFAIPGSLRDQPRHGYELKRALGGLGFWQVSFGSLHPALRRLEKKGSIEATKGGDPGSQSRRKAYRMTTAGRDEFVRLLADVPDGYESDRGFQLRLAFFAHLDPKERIRVLEDRRMALSSRLRGDRTSFLGARRIGSDTDRSRLALMERRVHSTEADTAWLDELKVWDSPNSAEVIIDAVRTAKIAMDRGLGGPLLAPSSYFMKSPPVQYRDVVAVENLEAFIAGDDRTADDQMEFLAG